MSDLKPCSEEEMEVVSEFYKTISKQAMECITRNNHKDIIDESLNLQRTINIIMSFCKSINHDSSMLTQDHRLQYEYNRLSQMMELKYKCFLAEYSKK